MARNCRTGAKHLLAACLNFKAYSSVVNHDVLLQKVSFLLSLVKNRSLWRQVRHKVLGALMTPYPFFRDRTDAGEQLAEVVQSALNETAAVAISASPIVYALPRGGLPVAAPVARLLGCPLDIVVAKKISHPKNPELAIGAVTASGEILWSTPAPFDPPLGHRQAALSEAVKQARALETQLSLACPQHSADATPDQINLEGTIAILVDDGIATGMTIAVAAQALRVSHPAAVWICAPVAPLSLLPRLQSWGDRVIVLETPQSFLSVSRFYAQFPQVETKEALTYLHQQNDSLEARS